MEKLTKSEKKLISHALLYTCMRAKTKEDLEINLKACAQVCKKIEAYDELLALAQTIVQFKPYIS